MTAPAPPKSKSKHGGELAFIAAIRNRRQPDRPSLRVGIGDDCAIIRPGSGEEIAITTDFTLENVHFRQDWHAPESAGHRCLTRGLSDLAAMGARPVAAFLSLALPAGLTRASGRQKSWAIRFLDGLMALADRLNVPLAGGDTSQSPNNGDRPGLVTADIVLVGAVKRGHALLRSGARPGDLLYVTGSLGGSAAELQAIERHPERFQPLANSAPNHPHLYPEPRIAIGQALARRYFATAAIDLSDGLSTDLHHLCEESNLHAQIHAEALPIHPMARLAEAAAWAPSALNLALHGGEDYELLFTATPHTKVPAQIAGIPIHRIGQMNKPIPKKQPIQLTAHDGKSTPLPRAGWEYFQK